MFCSKCGSQIADGSAFCPVCGQAAAAGAPPVQQAQPQYQQVQQPQFQQPQYQQPQQQFQQPQQQFQQPQYQQPQQQFQQPAFNNPAGYQMPQQAAVQPGSNKNLIIGIVVIVAVIAAIVVSIILLGDKKSGGKDDDDTPAYEKPVETLCDALMKGDSKKIYQVTMPKSVIKYYEEEGYIDWDVMDETLEDALDEFRDEFGDNFKLTYKVTDKKKLSDSKIDNYESTYSMWASMTDKDEDDFVPSEAYKLEVELTAKGSEDKDTDEGSVVVAKVDGSWIFLDMGFMSSMTY